MSDNMASASCNGGSKITDWFVYDARAKPAERIVGGIKQIAAARAANADFVVNARVVHKNTPDGFACASGGHGRRVGDVGVGKRDGVCGKRAKTW